METWVWGGIALAFVVLLAGWAHARRRPRHARLSPDGVQEVTIVVRERYVPPVVVARRGVPLRLNFRREEENPCSQRVFFPDFGITRSLPAWRTTTIELLPHRDGEFLFTCELGMYQGTLRVVASPSPWPRFRRRRTARGERPIPQGSRAR